MSSDPPVLTGQQRKWLRGRAHPLKPLVHVGEAGLSEAVIAATKAALDQHELIKIRLHQPSEKRETAAAIADATGATLCGLVGHTVILYQPNPDQPRLSPPGFEA